MIRPAAKGERPLSAVVALVSAAVLALAAPTAEASRYLPNDLASADLAALPGVEALDQVDLEPAAEEVKPRQILLDDEAFSLLSLLPLLDQQSRDSLLSDNGFQPLTNAYAGALRRAIERVWAEELASGGESSGETRNYLLDEWLWAGLQRMRQMGSVVSIVEDVPTPPGSDNVPPLKARILYDPYGQAHVESGPELRSVKHDAELVEVDDKTQDAMAEDPPGTEVFGIAGSLVITTSIGLDEESLEDGLAVERWDSLFGAFVELDETQVAVEVDGTELNVMPVQGWLEGARYRLHLTDELTDRYGRSFVVPGGGSEKIVGITIPAEVTSTTDELPNLPPDVPVVFDSRVAAAEQLDCRAAPEDPYEACIPGGVNVLFQGLWTDPSTGIAYARNRWFESRTASWLSEDPLGAVDSSNLYAFVGWGPHMGVDPLGAQGGAALVGLEGQWLGEVGEGFLGRLRQMGVGLVHTVKGIPAWLRDDAKKERFEAFDEGGYEAYKKVLDRQAEETGETLKSLIPFRTTVRDLRDVPRAYAEEGPYGANKKIGEALCSGTVDAAAVYGGCKALATSTRPVVNPVVAQLESKGATVAAMAEAESAAVLTAAVASADEAALARLLSQSGADIALGLDARLELFGRSVKAHTYVDWRDAGLVSPKPASTFPDVFAEASSKARTIRFDLDDLDLSRAVAEGRMGFSEWGGNWTNAELYAIRSQPALWEKAFFYKNGKLYAKAQLLKEIEAIERGLEPVASATN
jgi:RHS repeat-associated protein